MGGGPRRIGGPIWLPMEGVLCPLVPFVIPVIGGRGTPPDDDLGMGVGGGGWLLAGEPVNGGLVWLTILI